MRQSILTLMGILALTCAGCRTAVPPQPAPRSGPVTFGAEKPAAPAAPTPATEPVTPAVSVPLAPESARPNQALIPHLSAGFMNRHNSFVEIARKGDIDLLFMGDSITDFWRNSGRSVFDQNFGSYRVANFGIAADTTQGVLWRLQNGEGQGFKPKAVMLMIGTNNLSASLKPAQVAMGIAAIVFEMRKDFPEAKILLLGIFPRSDRPFRPQITTTNAIISCLHDGEHVFYLDIGDRFLAPDGTIPREIMRDGLHPTTRGYEIWAQAVKETLDGFMK